ncbi:MAG: hypothetical protein IKY10_02095, partial [Clostridia bacterium]|nr:hypothetical protein [Clostridia bacterium]
MEQQNQQITIEKEQLEESIEKENGVIEQLQKKYQTVKSYDERVEELRRTVAIEQQVEEQLLKTETFLKELEKSKEECSQYIPVIDELKIQIEELKKCTEAYGKLESLLKNKNNVSDKMEQAKKMQQQAAEKIQYAEQEQTKRMSRLEEIKNVDVLVTNLEYQIEKLQSRKKKLQDLGTRLESAVKQEKQFVIKQKEYQKQQEKLDLAAKDSMDKNRLFFAGQAGVLAKGLKELVETEKTAVCPVCGGVVEESQLEKLAKTEDDIPTQESVERARERLEFEQARTAELARACEVAKNSLAMERKEILRFSEEIFENNQNFEKLFETEFVAEETKTVDVHLLEEQRKLKEQKAIQLEKAKLESSVAEHTKNIEKLKEVLEANKAVFTKYEKESAVLDKEMETIRQTLRFDSKEQVEIEKKHLENKKNAMEQEIAEIEKSYNHSREELSNLQGQKKSLKLQKADQKAWICKMQEENSWLKDAETDRTILCTIDEALKAKLSLKKELEGERNKRLVWMDKISSSLKTVKNITAELQKTEPAFEKLWKLSSMANGQSGEGGKYSFSRYVLGTFFEEVIDQANYHLNHMTG